MNPQANAKLFAPCPRGLENPLAAELAGLGASAVQAVAGGVAFEGDTRVIYRANLESRIATRVLLRLFSAALSQRRGHLPRRLRFRLAAALRRRRAASASTSPRSAAR